MSLAVWINTIISFLIFIITFSISLQSNLFLGALFRAFIVFIISFISLFLCIYIFKEMGKSNTNMSQTNHFEPNKEESIDREIAKSVNEEGKGGMIDFQTPDEDHIEFKPFQPRKLEDRDE